MSFRNNLFDCMTAEQELTSEGYASILNSRFLQRLKGVSYLSTLDYIYNVDCPSNRYEHSVCTARIALQIACKLKLDTLQTQILVLANLLHDIGHAPFSHNSEPFLLEQRGLYHTGVATTYLRNSVQVGGERINLTELLERDYPDAVTPVCQLLTKRLVDDPAIEVIYRASVNCDKIEGTNRTLQHLKMDFIEPHEIINCFSGDSSGIYVKRSSLPVLLRFWKLQEVMYWDRIYTLDVFGAEAMLTRALERVYLGPEKISEFMMSEDCTVSDEFSKDNVANLLFSCLLKQKYMSALSTEDRDLMKFYENDVISARFNKVRRRELEAEIAHEIGTDPDLVVSHFSLRKQFLIDETLLSQPLLFDDNSDFIPLDRVNKALYTARLSGDFFDVYFMMPL